MSVADQVPTHSPFHAKSTGAEVLEIRVSRMSDRRYEFLLALHELIEAFLCDWRGIPFDLITRFDIEYESRRTKGEAEEPGASPRAPSRGASCAPTPWCGCRSS